MMAVIHFSVRWIYPLMRDANLRYADLYYAMNDHGTRIIDTQPGVTTYLSENGYLTF